MIQKAGWTQSGLAKIQDVIIMENINTNSLSASNEDGKMNAVDPIEEAIAYEE